MTEPGSAGKERKTFPGPRADWKSTGLQIARGGITTCWVHIHHPWRWVHHHQKASWDIWLSPSVSGDMKTGDASILISCWYEVNAVPQWASTPRPAHFFAKIPQHHINVQIFLWPRCDSAPVGLMMPLCHSSSVSDVLTQAEPNTPSRAELGSGGFDS